MKQEFKLEQFSGPLDLLISLIGEEKLDISEISLSVVTEQFLKYLEAIEEREPEELADFLVIATRLLLLKSKKLLPQFSPDDEQGPSLEEQLKLYKAFVEASKKFNKRWLEGNFAAFRIEPPKKAVGFVAPINFSLEFLQQAMLKLVLRLKPLRDLPQTLIDKGVTMKEKLDVIRNLLKHSKEISFNEVLQNSQNRTEVIVTFLALLELVKANSVALKQDDTFSDITIFKT